MRGFDGGYGSPNDNYTGDGIYGGKKVTSGSNVYFGGGMGGGPSPGYGGYFSNPVGYTNGGYGGGGGGNGGGNISNFKGVGGPPFIMFEWL